MGSLEREARLISSSSVRGRVFRGEAARAARPAVARTAATHRPARTMLLPFAFLFGLASSCLRCVNGVRRCTAVACCGIRGSVGATVTQIKKQVRGKKTEGGFCSDGFFAMDGAPVGAPAVRGAVGVRAGGGRRDPRPDRRREEGRQGLGARGPRVRGAVAGVGAERRRRGPVAVGPEARPLHEAAALRGRVRSGSDVHRFRQASRRSPRPLLDRGRLAQRRLAYPRAPPQRPHRGPRPRQSLATRPSRLARLDYVVDRRFLSRTFFRHHSLDTYQ
mmetsp:Transcript_12615/g.41360  ORF Transcript_12615/g.41360 Transcript_12615/m.41360 type:complete len:276 (-) Transcript_12615:38-865(-)